MAETKEKKVRKSPVPSDPKRIVAGAMKLQLSDKVALRNELAKSIEDELQALETKLKESRNIANGMK